MPIKAVVETLDEIDAKYHDLYTQKGDKYELTGVEGVKTQGDFDRVHSALAKERNDHKAVRERFSALGDRDVNEVLSSLDRIPELEALAAGGKLDDAKINELLEPKLKSKLGPLEREKATLSTKVTELTAQVTTYQAKETTRTIHDSVRESLAKIEGFQASAVDDALLYAERMLEIQDGKVVTRDSVGVTPGVDAAVWLTEMQQKKPHWWGASAGGGSQGSRATQQSGSNPWSADGWNMTEQGKIYSENPTRAAQLAKSAGTTIGGMRPVKK